MGRASFFSLLVALYTAMAIAEPFGKWNVNASDSGDFLYAATMNDSGSTFGQFCYTSDGACFWLLDVAIPCDSGSLYPVLLNSDIGARQLQVKCGTSRDGTYTYGFTDFTAVDGIVKESQIIGIAFPLQKDQFKVVRFDLSGAAKAISTMREAFNRIQKEPSKLSNKDQLM